jgi:hypothetical protein
MKKERRRLSSLAQKHEQRFAEVTDWAWSLLESATRSVIKQLVKQSDFVHGKHSTEDALPLVGEYLAETGLSEDEMDLTALLGTNALHGYAVGLNEHAEQVQIRVGNDDWAAWANIHHLGQAFHRSPLLKPHLDEELQTEKDTNPRFAELSSDMQEHIDAAITLYLDGTAITEIEEDIENDIRIHDIKGG